MNRNIHYIRSGDYIIPDLKLTEESRPIGKWGRMHRDYLKENHPTKFNTLVLSGKLWTYLADLNEQAQHRMEILIDQLSNFSNKLARGSLRYEEAVQLAEVLGYDLVWQKRRNT